MNPWINSVASLLYICIGMGTGFSLGNRAETFYYEERDLCATDYSWKNLTSAISLAGQRVRIIQTETNPQWFYTGSCKSDVVKRPCPLVSDTIESFCETKEAPAMAYVVPEGKEGLDGVKPEALHIRIPIACVCTVRAKIVKERPTDVDRILDLFSLK